VLVICGEISGFGGERWSAEMTSTPPATRNKSRVNRALRICSRVVLLKSRANSRALNTRSCLTHLGIPGNFPVWKGLLNPCFSAPAPPRPSETERQRHGTFQTFLSSLQAPHLSHVTSSPSSSSSSGRPSLFKGVVDSWIKTLSPLYYPLCTLLLQKEIFLASSSFPFNNTMKWPIFIRLMHNSSSLLFITWNISCKSCGLQLWCFLTAPGHAIPQKKS